MINRYELAREAYFGLNSELDDFIRAKMGKVIRGKNFPKNKISLEECHEVVNGMDEELLTSFYKITF
jgi:hypothetical protein